MKYFLDTGFIEGWHKPLFGKRRHFIDLISIGIKCEDGRAYYAISNEFNPSDADEWVKENVISKLEPKGSYQKLNGVENLLWKSNKQIAKEIIDFVNPNIKDLIYTFIRHDCWIEEYYKKEFEYIKNHNTIIPDSYFRSSHDKWYERNRELIYNKPEFYAYFADYDWVVFCSLFGRMIELPKGFPMYCKDLKQTMDELGLDKEWKRINCPDPPGAHNALADAQWNFKLFDVLSKLKK